jgi:hypothetical protein
MAERPDGVAALELGDRLLKRPHRRGAEPPIGVFLLVRFERSCGRKQNGGAAIDRRIDEAVEALRLAPGMRKPRILLLTW